MRWEHGNISSHPGASCFKWIIIIVLKTVYNLRYTYLIKEVKYYGIPYVLSIVCCCSLKKKRKHNDFCKKSAKCKNKQVNKWQTLEVRVLKVWVDYFLWWSYAYTERWIKFTQSCLFIFFSHVITSGEIQYNSSLVGSALSSWGFGARRVFFYRCGQYGSFIINPMAGHMFGDLSVERPGG